MVLFVIFFFENTPLFCMDVVCAWSKWCCTCMLAILWALREALSEVLVGESSASVTCTN